MFENWVVPSPHIENRGPPSPTLVKPFDTPEIFGETFRKLSSPKKSEHSGYTLHAPAGLPWKENFQKHIQWSRHNDRSIQGISQKIQRLNHFQSLTLVLEICFCSVS